jgi:hypothetical protein
LSHPPCEHHYTRTLQGGLPVCAFGLAQTIPQGGMFGSEVDFQTEAGPDLPGI